LNVPAVVIEGCPDTLLVGAHSAEAIVAHLRPA
jgi:hypothetical protein